MPSLLLLLTFLVAMASSSTSRHADRTSCQEIVLFDPSSSFLQTWHGSDSPLPVIAVSNASVLGWKENKGYGTRLCIGAKSSLEEFRKEELSGLDKLEFGFSRMTESGLGRILEVYGMDKTGYLRHLLCYRL